MNDGAIRYIDNIIKVEQCGKSSTGSSTGSLDSKCSSELVEK